MTTKTEAGVPTRFTTGKVRLTYAFIWQARVQSSDDKDNDGDAKEKYSSSLLIPKSDQLTIQKLNAAIQQAVILGQKKGLWGDKLPSNFHYPLRDGDAETHEKGEAYAGNWFLNASSTSQPRIVDINREDILEESEVYSGCYARVVLNLYPFNKRGNRGIACGLEVIQKVANGEHLGTAPINLEEALGDYFDDGGDLPFPGEPGYDGPMPANFDQQPQYKGYPQGQQHGYPPQAPPVYQQQQGYIQPPPIQYTQPPPHGSQQSGSILPHQPPGYPPQYGQGYAHAASQIPGFPGAIPDHLAAGVAAADQHINQMMVQAAKRVDAA